MKTQQITLKLLFLTALVALPACISQAATVSIEDWYAINSNANATIAGGNTTSPDYQNNNSQNINRIFSYFGNQTLADGDKWTLSFSLTLTLAGSNTTKTFKDFRYGLFEANTPHATTSTFGADRVSSSGSYSANWKGFLLRDPGNASGDMRIYRKAGTGNETFSAVGDSNANATLGTTGNYSFIFTDGVAREFTFILQRSGSDLLLSGSYGTGNFSGMMTGAFTGGTYDVFDVFGFYAAAQDNVDIDNALFSNVSLNIVPEPQVAGLLVVGLLALSGIAVRKKRMRGFES